MKTELTKMVELNDAELDQVAAGQLIGIAVVDAVDIEDNEVAVAVPVNASVAAGILGNAASGALQTRPGRIRQ